MNARYAHALKAGAIGGIVTAICVLIFMAIIMAISGSDYILGVEGLLVILFVLLTFGTGALSIALSRQVISDWQQIAITSGLSGSIAGIAGGIAFSAVWFLAPFFLLPDKPFTGSEGSDVMTTSLVSFFCGAAACGCMPFFIAAAACSAAAGGAIYWHMFLKSR